MQQLLPQRCANPKTGLLLKLVQDGTHAGQKAGGLGLEQQAQKADCAEAELAGDLATAPLVQQDGVRMNLNG